MNFVITEDQLDTFGLEKNFFQKNQLKMAQTQRMIYFVPKHEVTKLAGSEILNLPAQEHHAGLGFLPSFHSDILSVGTGSSMDRIGKLPFQASHTNQTR